MRFVVIFLFAENFGLFHFVMAQNAIHKTIEEVVMPPVVKDDGSQTYRFKFKTSNNIEREESGEENPDSDVGLIVRGSYGYIGPDGSKVFVRYIADKNGFRIIPKSAVQTVLRIAPAALASLAG